MKWCFEVFQAYGSYWFEWLVLRDILKTASNITSTAYKEGVMPLDTGNQLQVVCTVGQTDGHSSSDHTMSRADIQWDRIGP